MQIKSIKSERILAILAIILVFVSLYLAYVIRFKNFYELLLLGITLFLFSFKAVRRVKIGLYLRLYVLFFFAGLIGDLVLGLNLTPLWYYNYDSVIQYFLLYNWVYPVGGFSTILLFLVLIDWFNLDLDLIKNTKAKRFDIIIFVTLNLVILALLTIHSTISTENYSHIIIFGSISLFTVLLLSFLSERQHQVSYFSLLRINPTKVIFATIITTLTSAGLHEIPNTVARQWVYINIPFSEITIFEVPILIFFGWIILLLGPLAIFLKHYSILELKQVIKD